MEGNSVVDDILDECSQFRVLLVGSSRGKAQLLREIFGVNKITRYPSDFSRDEELYSKENEFFVAHVFDDWQGVGDVLQRRARGEPDEIIHCIWHYIDSQDAPGLATGAGSDQACPLSIHKYGVPVITVFGRFDNIVTRAAELGQKRRLVQNLSDAEKSDAAQIHRVIETIHLYLLQYEKTTAIASKAASSKMTFLNVVIRELAKNKQAQLLLIIAQRLNPTWKFETSLSLAMKQFLIGTVSAASPLPIPFAGLIGSQAATYMIKQDIIRVWNIYDPKYLCANTGGQSLMDTLLGIPKMGAKRLLYMIPVVGQISGIWETPILARALGGLMIDLTLLMERAFLATMGIDYMTGSPIKTPVRRLPDAESPRTPARLGQQSKYGKNGYKSPLSAEVLRNRESLMSPIHQVSPLRQENGPISLIDLVDDDTDRPATPPRPPTAPKPNSTKPALPPKPPRPKTPQSATSRPMSGSPAMPAIELSTPTRDIKLDLMIRPASLPLTEEILRRLVEEYEPVKAAVKSELEEFFDQEGQGLKRSFQKDTVRRKLDEIVHGWRLSEVVDMV